MPDEKHGSVFGVRKVQFRKTPFTRYCHMQNEEGEKLLFSEDPGRTGSSRFGLYYDADLKEKALEIEYGRGLDMGMVYRITDSMEGAAVGSIGHGGVNTILHEHWKIYDSSGTEKGVLKGRSLAGVIAGKFFAVIPHSCLIATTAPPVNLVAKLRESPGFGGAKLSMEIVQPFPSIDRRLIISAGFLKTIFKKDLE